ncbi:MAG: hypothetical protein PVH84_18110, partial [Candidatus Aminicenantes bacterium]
MNPTKIFASFFSILFFFIIALQTGSVKAEGSHKFQNRPRSPHKHQNIPQKARMIMGKKDALSRVNDLK